MQSQRKNSMFKPLALVAIALALTACTRSGVTQRASAQDTASLFGPQGVRPDAVRQGILGSCYFHSSIAALAKAAPETLRSAIRPGPLGGYKVHFYSGPDETVFPDDVEYGRAHSFDRSDGDWVLVLMRGYAQRAVRQGLAKAIEDSTIIPSYAKPIALDWLNDSGLLLVAYDRAIRSVVSQDGMMDQATFRQSLKSELSALGISDAHSAMLVGFLDGEGFFDRLALTVQQNGEVFGAYKAMGQGGMPSRVMEAFIGSANTVMTTDREATIEHLRQLHRDNTAMVAATLSTAPADLAGANWWVGGHAYSVLDYDETSQTVSLRNPWGSHPDPDGSFTLPLAAFLDGFDFASYSGKP
jgi:Calpain family cysteine protease